MNDFIPLSSVSLGTAEVTQASEAIATGWISATGPYVGRFESLIADRSGRRHAVAVSNGTVAIEVVLRALGIGPGDEVIVPALTFAAPAAVVASVGAIPVLVDVEAASWTLDPTLVPDSLTKRTKAVIGVDVMGHPCDYNRLAQVTGDAVLIEDAAEAHGARYWGVPVGRFGLAATFSFHANKIITTGEGGAVVGDDDALMGRIRLLMNHGMTKERPYWHDVVGHNFRMTNVTAAIGAGQAARWDELVAARNRIACLYDEALAGIGGIYRRPVASWATEACWLYAIGVEGGHRSTVLDRLRAERVDARAIWTALPDLPVYAVGARGRCDVARRLAAEVLWLPTWIGLTEGQIGRIADTVRSALSSA